MSYLPRTEMSIFGASIVSALLTIVCLKIDKDHPFNLHIYQFTALTYQRQYDA
jgi:hypothetical protein